MISIGAGKLDALLQSMSEKFKEVLEPEQLSVQTVAVEVETTMCEPPEPKRRSEQPPDEKREPRRFRRGGKTCDYMNIA